MPKVNEARWDRATRLALGVVFGALALLGVGGTLVTVLLGIGSVLMFVTAAVGFCPAYALFGLSTCPMQKTRP